jgi:hypothetical protein
VPPNASDQDQNQLLPRVLPNGAITITILAVSVAIMLAATKPVPPKKPQNNQTQISSKATRKPTKLNQSQNENSQNKSSLE